VVGFVQIACRLVHAKAAHKGFEYFFEPVYHVVATKQLLIVGAAAYAGSDHLLVGCEMFGGHT